MNLNHLHPASNQEKDLAARQRVYDETHSIFLDPIYLNRYPEEFYNWLGPHSPRIEANDLEKIYGSSDFLGLNHYNTDIVHHDHFGGWLKARLEPYSAPGWGFTEMGWGINPEGIKAEVLNIKNNYGNPKLIITENGCAAPDIPNKNGFVTDLDRIRFLRAHLIKLHESIQEGSNLQGYFTWSVFDNFEWERGYSKRFGLIHIDYDTHQRTPKQSAYWYQDVIQNNAVDI